MTENTVIDLCNKNNWVPYMEAKQCFYDLVKGKFISTMSMKSDRFKLTGDGRNCLKEFYQEIPLSIRDSIRKYCKNYKNIIKNRKNQDCVANYFPNPNGSYTVELEFIDDIELQSFKITMNVEDKEKANDVCYRWKDNATDIYRMIYDNLLDK